MTRVSSLNETKLTISLKRSSSREFLPRKSAVSRAFFSHATRIDSVRDVLLKIFWFGAKNVLTNRTLSNLHHNTTLVTRLRERSLSRYCSSGCLDFWCKKLLCTYTVSFCCNSLSVLTMWYDISKTTKGLGRQGYINHSHVMIIFFPVSAEIQQNKGAFFTSFRA